MPRALKFPNKDVGERLKELRTGRKLSLDKVSKLLAPHVNNIQLAGESGKTRILAIEKATGNLTVELAAAYSKVFDVSLEYLFCLSDDMRPENKSIKEVLGLTDTAISRIRSFSDKNNSKTKLQILNTLFESEFMTKLVDSLDSFIYTSRSYDNYVTLDFDDRKEDDKEVVKLIPRWRLDKSVSTLIDEIAVLLEADE